MPKAKKRRDEVEQVTDAQTQETKKKKKESTSSRKTSSQRMPRQQRIDRAQSGSDTKQTEEPVSNIDGSGPTSVDATCTNTEGVFPSEANLLDAGCDGVVESFGGSPSPDSGPYDVGPGIGGFGDPNIGTAFFQ